MLNTVVLHLVGPGKKLYQYLAVLIFFFNAENKILVDLRALPRVYNTITCYIYFSDAILNDERVRVPYVTSTVFFIPF